MGSYGILSFAISVVVDFANVQIYYALVGQWDLGIIALCVRDRVSFKFHEI